MGDSNARAGYPDIAVPLPPVWNSVDVPGRDVLFRPPGTYCGPQLACRVFFALRYPSSLCSTPKRDLTTPPSHGLYSPDGPC